VELARRSETEGNSATLKVCDLLRIISGTEKGRKLFTPPARETTIRPTSDRAREALFNILGTSIQGAKVLDLFSGTGALGLEAFSRHAAFVVFVDNSPLALELIKKNINLCFKGYKGNCEIRVIRHDLTRNLPINKLPPATQAGFDIILADPPYAKGISLAVLDWIDKNRLLADNGMLIVEERFNIALPSQLSRLCLIDKRVYGETGFWLYKSLPPTPAGNG
jgi:16S rRNA (guanine966-N2)-methyltransferase